MGILYVIARLCFPAEMTDVDLEAYYSGVADKIWWLLAATYASFAFLMAPFVYGLFLPLVFASQILVAALALVSIRVKSPSFHIVVIVIMFAQVLWRGFAYSIGG